MSPQARFSKWPARAERLWAQRSAASAALFPLSLLYCAAMETRRRLYQGGLLRQVRCSVPVIVVGNLTVGGSGKTPLVQWMVEHLRSRGRQPGIVTRGYRGTATAWPQVVTADSDPQRVGDEAVMLAQGGIAVVAGPHRPACAARLVEHFKVDLVISDDGLQHLALGRDLEIVVIDGQRRLGNGWCLPAGPLRETSRRLQTVDACITNGQARGREFAMRVTGETLSPLSGAGEGRPLSAWAGRRVHAVAGLGNPQRFFALLRARGLEITPHAYPDHHAYNAPDIVFPDDAPVIMTAKDAVKCRAFATGRHWVLPVTARPEATFADWLDRAVERFPRGQTTA